MRYILQDDWCLRGYSSGTVQALVNSRTFGVHTVSDALAEVLRLCDGCLDFDLPLFPKALTQLAEKAAEEGWVRPALDGERLAERQKYRQTEAPLMACVVWSLTGKCNASCRHCCQNAPGKGREELTTREALDAIQELGKCQVPSVSLTGGEPLVRRDLPQILDALEASGIGVSALSTNGFLLDENMVQLFQAHGMHPNVQISFDGVGCHDYLRGVDGAEKLALRAVEVCISHGWNVTFAMCLHRGNLGSIQETIQLAAKMGVRKVRMCPVSEMGAFKGGNGLDLLGISETYQLYYDLAQWYLKERPHTLLSLQGTMELDFRDPSKCFVVPLMHSCLDAKGNKVCDAASKHPVITEDGRLLPCFALVETGVETEYSKMAGLDLTSCMESEAYRAFSDITVTDILETNPRCADCEFLSYCGCGCRAASLIAGNGYRGIDPARCAFFQGGWHKKFAALCV